MTDDDKGGFAVYCLAMTLALAALTTAGFWWQGWNPFFGFLLGLVVWGWVVAAAAPDES